MHLTLDEFSNIKDCSKEEEEELDFCLPGRDLLMEVAFPTMEGFAPKGQGFLLPLHQFSTASWLFFQRVRTQKCRGTASQLPAVYSGSIH